MSPETATPLPPLDLDVVKPRSEVEVSLVHPGTFEPLGATITMAGLNHPATLEARRRVLDEVARSIRPGTPARGFRKQTAAQVDVTGEQVEEATTDALVLRTLGFAGILRHGEPIPFSAESVRDLYTNPNTSWIREQVAAALREDERFFD